MYLYSVIPRKVCITIELLYVYFQAVFGIQDLKIQDCSELAVGIVEKLKCDFTKGWIF